MAELLRTEPMRVGQWVHERVWRDEVAAGIDPPDFGPFHAIGVLVGGEIIAGIVFHDWRPWSGVMEITMAADSPRWATRGTIRELLAYPFIAAGANKVRTATPHTNERAIRFNKGIGFKQEGTLAEEFGPGRHAVMCRMLRKDYFRIYGENA